MTEQLHHKIVLISAVIGNRNHIFQWLSTENENREPLEFHRDWRGPRRIHAVWSTDAFWTASSIERNEKARKYFYQKITPLYGRLDVRISHTGLAHSFHTENPVGKLVQKAEEEFGDYIKDKSKSTPFYRMLVSVIEYLGEFGPVLIIESTKPGTIRLAEAIAETQERINQPQIVNLIDFVSARLGDQHPLKNCLEKGVAYHHGSLPREIRNSIEESVTVGYLKFIVATTTLTEGVNLPVTSVVIASQGSHGEGGTYTEYITGSKLVNAIGRAGRATKETEGIVVLARQAEVNIEDFERLDPSEDDLHVSSMLATEKALEALSLYEELCRISEDAVFETDNDEVKDFLKFVWFISSEFEKLNHTLDIDRIEGVLSQTLGWVQLDQSNRKRWLHAASTALTKYQDTEVSIRRRWASSGTSISSSRIIERVVRDLVAQIEDVGIPQGVVEAVELIIADDRLRRILQLPEAPKRKVYTQRAGIREEILIPIGQLLVDRLRGMSLIEISERYFHRVGDINFRFEQLGDFINSRFEVFFPWVFGTVISWTNEMLSKKGFVSLIPTSLPANIRYGVSDPIALELMVRGIQSRRLSIKIAESWEPQDDQEDVVSWIRSLSLAQWSDLFDASPSEIRNLLEISRERGGVAVDLFNVGRADLNIGTVYTEYPLTNVTLQKLEDSEFSQIGVWDRDDLVGTIFSRNQVDILDLMNTGLSFSLEYSATAGRGTLSLELLEPN